MWRIFKEIKGTVFWSCSATSAVTVHHVDVALWEFGKQKLLASRRQMENRILRNVMQYRMKKVYQRFGGTYCFQLQDQRISRASNFFARLTLWPWRRKQYFPLKRRQKLSGPNGVIVILMVIILRTSILYFLYRNRFVWTSLTWREQYRLRVFADRILAAK
jgi:hypothetical protein